MLRMFSYLNKHKNSNVFFFCSYSKIVWSSLMVRMCATFPRFLRELKENIYLELLYVGVRFASVHHYNT